MRLRRAVIAAGLIATCLASTAQADPWPRGKGNQFVAAALRGQMSVDGTWSRATTYYREYGMTDNWTFGVDVGGAISGFDKSVVFVSRPVLSWSEWRLAAELGAGKVASAPVIRPGLSIGRSIGPMGWLSVETTAELRLDGTRAVDWKVDATIGRDVLRQSKIYTQLQTGEHFGKTPFARLEVSIAHHIAKDVFIDIGVATVLVNSDPLRVKIGLWRNF